MHNLGLILSLCLLFSFPAWAEEAKETDVKQAPLSEEKSQPTDEIEISEENPIVIKSPDGEGSESPIEETARPSCDNKRLIEGIVNKIKDYQKEHPSKMLIEKRRDSLLLKNLSSFEEVSAKNFTGKQNFNVANRIIMAKINKGILEQTFVLCKSKGQGNAGDVYALLYPIGDGYVVEVINFLPGSDDDSEFSFIFN